MDALFTVTQKPSRHVSGSHEIALSTWQVRPSPLYDAPKLAHTQNV